jgi:excisionase family DNA binding protein
MIVASNTNAESAEQSALLTPKQAAEWLGIAERTLLANARRRRIPAVRLNARVLRFHLPSVLAALQKGGVR